MSVWVMSREHEFLLRENRWAMKNQDGFVKKTIIFGMGDIKEWCMIIEYILLVHI